MMRDRTSFWFDSITYDRIKSDYKAVKQDFNYYIKDKQLRSPTMKTDGSNVSIRKYSDNVDSPMASSVAASSAQKRGKDDFMSPSAAKSLFVQDFPTKELENLGYDRYRYEF